MHFMLCIKYALPSIKRIITNRNNQSIASFFIFGCLIATTRLLITTSYRLMATSLLSRELIQKHDNKLLKLLYAVDCAVLICAVLAIARTKPASYKRQVQ